jgi:glucans biosynthesis protein C
MQTAADDRSAAPLGPTSRVTYVDWLRALAVLGVFVFHAVHPFDTIDWHVKNAEQSEGLTLMQAFFASWGLAFFFFVAGVATCLALRWRSTRQFVAERVGRLLLPFVVAWVVLSPIQSYIEETFAGRDEGSFVAFIPLFFERALRELRTLGPIQPIPLDKSYHLWFLIFLLEFSLLCIPLFAWLRGGRGRAFVARLGTFARRRGAIVLLGIPLAVLNIAVHGAPGDEHSWTEFGYYLMSFVAGYVLMSDDRLIAAERRDLVPLLVTAVTATAALVASDVVGFADRYGAAPPYSPFAAWIFFVLMLQSWAWTLVALSVGMRVRRFGRPLPRTVADASLPFFLLHQPIVLAVAFLVVRWDASIGVKVIAEMAIALALT